MDDESKEVGMSEQTKQWINEGVDSPYPAIDLDKAVDSCPDGHYLDVATGEIKPIISFAYDPAHETRGGDVEPDSIAHVVPKSLTELSEIVAERRAEIAAERKADALSGEVHKWSFMKPEGEPLHDKVADLSEARTRAKLAQEALDPFIRKKIVTLKGGPADGDEQPRETMPSDGLICFFANNNGIPEQAVYKIVMKEKERTEDERKAGKAVEWEWIAEYQGKRRYVPLGTVNGIRKGS